MASACKVAPAELECAICCELLIDPRNLECSHTFCMRCLILLYQTKQQGDRTVDCPLCRQVTCLEEGDLSSLQPNIEIQSAVESFEKKNDSLKERVEARLNMLLEHISLINDVEDTVTITHNRTMNAIDEAFNDALQKLTGRNDELVEKCLKFKHDQMTKLNVMRETSGDIVSRISSAFEKICQDAMMLLEGESFAVHESARSALQDMLDQNEPDASEPNAIAEHSANVKFMRLPGQSGMDMGILRGIDSTPTDMARLVTEFPVDNDKVGGMVMMPNDRVALGFRNGGIQIFNRDGAGETVLENVQVWGLARFPDGRFIVRDRENNITLFTREMERQSTTFETLCWQEGGQGDIQVDGRKNIYVSYWLAMMIQMFSEAGGKPIKEIHCSGYVPSQFCVSNDGGNVLVQDGPTVWLIDEGGVAKHEITKEGVVGYPALDVIPCLGDDGPSILIAWVNDQTGIVTMERYTDTLTHKASLVAGYKVDSAWPSRCFIRVSDEGLVAFYRNSRLYYFHIPLSARCCIL